MKIIGTGSYLPEKILNNEELTKIVDTSDEWITERTGIKERRISTGDEDSDLARKAAKAALDDSGLNPMDIDMILIATITPDYITPSISCVVQKDLGAFNAICMDINAACSGFLYALNTAHCYMMAGMIKTAIIVGSENLSKITDYTNRSTCVLFGDAAGAVVVQKSDSNRYSCILGTDSTKGDSLLCKHVALNNLYCKKEVFLDYLHMDGQTVFKFVLRTVPKVIRQVLEKEKIDENEIKYFLLHQANQRINDAVAKKLNISSEKFPHNLEKTGNTSSATIPVLLDEICKKGMLNRGDKIMMCAFGGGLTWGAILIEW